MTSNDKNITIEMIDGGIQEIKSSIQELAAQRKVDMAVIDGKLTEIKSEIYVTNNRINNMTERLEDLKFFGTIGLAIIAIFIAIVALVPMFRREKSEVRTEDLSPRNIRDIRALIREEFSLLNSLNRGNQL
ncbi:MAG: hypothetical protein IJ597_01115 [Synergistaceae bacterium]|nr:hypothetical protein [Synergistaceae bacterium]